MYDINNIYIMCAPVIETPVNDPLLMTHDIIFGTAIPFTKSFVILRAFFFPMPRTPTYLENHDHHCSLLPIKSQVLSLRDGDPMGGPVGVKIPEA